jgi:hypothetical protein
MNRFVFVVAAVTLPIVALAIAFALEGSDRTAAAAPSPPSSPTPTTPTPTLSDGRHFGYIKAVDVDASPGSIVFDVAEFLDGEAANAAAAAHGDEVPVSNDVYVVNDDQSVVTLPLTENADFLLLGPDYACCEGLPSTREDLANAHIERAWGYWVTLRGGKVAKIEEQWHP